MADLVQELEAAAAPLLAAAKEIAELRQQLAEARAALDELSAGAPSALPRRRKLWGTAATIDGDAAVYTEADVERHGKTCFARGVAHGRRQERSDLGLPPAVYGPTREEWDRDAAARNALRGG